MNTKKQLIWNIVGFQAGWFSCVLMAAQGAPAPGVLIAFIIILLHIFATKNKATTAIIFVVTMIIGSAWDSILINLGIFEFKSNHMIPQIVPVWIMAMWLLFATTLNISLRWLYNRYWLAVVIGAVSGPLAYQGGAALGGVTITGGLSANLAIATGWAFILPALIYLAQSLEQKSQARLLFK